MSEANSEILVKTYLNCNIFVLFVVVVNEGEFDRALKTASQKCFEEDEILNNIIRYKSVLRWIVSRTVGQQIILEKKSAGFDSSIDDLFDFGICSKDVYDEICSDIPPNMFYICQAIEKENLLFNTADAQRTAIRYVKKLKQEISIRPATLDYQKFIGDLYESLKKSKGRFDRATFETSLREAINENGGIIDLEVVLNKYFFGIKEDKENELTESYYSRLKDILSPRQIGVEDIKKEIFKAELNWYEKICS